MSNCHVSFAKGFVKGIIFRQLNSTDVAVVREVYDSDNSEDMFRMELERALEVRN